MAWPSQCAHRRSVQLTRISRVVPRIGFKPPCDNYWHGPPPKPPEGVEVTQEVFHGDSYDRYRFREDSVSLCSRQRTWPSCGSQEGLTDSTAALYIEPS